MRRSWARLTLSLSASIRGGWENHTSNTQRRHQRDATEIQALLQIAPRTSLKLSRSSSSSISATKFSAASIIAATSFLPNTVRAGQSEKEPSHSLHGATCAFFSRFVPLHDLHTDDGFRKDPCAACLSKRLHFLACQDFANDVASRSVSVARATDSSTQLSVSLKAAIESSFTTVENFLASLRLYCTSRRISGYTWVAWKEDTKTIVLVNVPSNTSPLSFGLWPLAALDLTDGLVTSIVEFERKNALRGDTQRPPPPSWSRAARNPKAVATGVLAAPAKLLGNNDGSTTAGAKTSVEVLDEAAQFYCKHLHWEFMSTQFASATAYYQSDARKALQRKRNDELRQAATTEVLSRHHVGEVVSDSGAVDEESTVPRVATPAAAAAATEATVASGASNEPAATPGSVEAVSTGTTSDVRKQSRSTTAEATGVPLAVATTAVPGTDEATVTAKSNNVVRSAEATPAAPAPEEYEVVVDGDTTTYVWRATDGRVTRKDVRFETSQKLVQLVFDHDPPYGALSVDGVFVEHLEPVGDAGFRASDGTVYH